MGIFLSRYKKKVDNRNETEKIFLNRDEILYLLKKHAYGDIKKIVENAPILVKNPDPKDYSTYTLLYFKTHD